MTPGPISTTDTIAHGGDLDAARCRFPDAPCPWVDLSTGVNPRSYPIGSIPPEAFHRLPAHSELRSVEQLAAAAYRVPAPLRVVAASGTQALIQVFPRLLPARSVAILGFGYQEHPAAWRAAGADVSVVGALADVETADVAVVVNPNNPDGRLVDPVALGSLAARMAMRGATLIVDEAFMDACDPGLSLVPYLTAEGAVVLRSFGKFFGLAGVRLGFAVTGHALEGRLRRALGPWPVSGPALVAAARALADRSWHRAELARLRADAARLDDLLVRAGLTVLGGTPLFRLAGHPAAAQWCERLGRRGILVRSFQTHPGWLRFGLPGDPDSWARLAESLGSAGL